VITADLIAIGIVAATALLGVVLGFGKGLKFFTSGIFGIIISVFVCYSIGGMVLRLEFVQNLLNRFAELWTGADKEGFFFDFLAKIHPEIIVYYIVLFIAVQIVRIILVRILKHIAEAKLTVVKIINRVLGAALFVAMAVLITLTVFQIIHWVGGTTAEELLANLEGSVFGLDKLFTNNPLLGLVEQVQGMIG